MTPVEAFPFHLCLRLGVAHPDVLYELLSAKQLSDWRAYHEQFCVAVGRDDPFRALALAMYHNAHTQDGDKVVEDFMLYCEDPRGDDDPDDGETAADFVAEIKALCRR